MVVVVVGRGGLRGVSAPSLTTLDQSKKLCCFFLLFFFKATNKSLHSYFFHAII